MSYPFLTLERASSVASAKASAKASARNSSDTPSKSSKQHQKDVSRCSPKGLPGHLAKDFLEGPSQEPSPRRSEGNCASSSGDPISNSLEESARASFSEPTIPILMGPPVNKPKAPEARSIKEWSKDDPNGDPTGSSDDRGRKSNPEKVESSLGSFYVNVSTDTSTRRVRRSSRHVAKISSETSSNASTQGPSNVCLEPVSKDAHQESCENALTNDTEETSDSTCPPTHIQGKYIPSIAYPGTHTLGPRLYPYVQARVHPRVKNLNLSRIEVVGEYMRDPDLARTSVLEKKDKLFNYQRPTAEMIGSHTLRLLCFPGNDYVTHHATIVATYLSLTSGRQGIVRYRITPPLTFNGRQLNPNMEPLIKSNLEDMGDVDIAVIGNVHFLDHWTHGTWEPNSDTELFSWQTTRSKQNHRIAFLGCRVSLWGDIAGNVINALQDINNVKCVIYVGKSTTLRQEYAPNEHITSGCRTILESAQITWPNPLERYLHQSPKIVLGSHFTMYSPLFETRGWFEGRRTVLSFVDSQIGHMAKAARDGDTQFGYLNIVSGNMARRDQYDEPKLGKIEVLQKRKLLFREIEKILGSFFDDWTHGPSDLEASLKGKNRDV